MSDFYTADRVLCPTPLRREVHRYSSTSARYEPLEVTVIESVYPSFVHLHADAKDPTWKWVACDYLGAIVALRLEEGFTLVSMSADGACLKRG